MKAIELHVIGAPPAREHYLVMSPEHAPALGDVTNAPAEVRFDRWCMPWADEAKETAIVYEVWQK